MDAFLRFCTGDGDPQDPAVRRRCGVLSGGIGIGLNLLLFLGKLLAGIMTASIAITADALNNLTDAASSVVTLIGFRLAGQEADEEHPFGHGRMEYLAGLVVSMLILLVGVELARSSFQKILHPEPVAFSALSAGILTAAVAVKLWMFWFNRGLSRHIQSAALSATAADSLSDAAATGTLLLGGWAWGLPCLSCGRAGAPPKTPWIPCWAGPWTGPWPPTSTVWFWAMSTSWASMTWCITTTVPAGL